MISQENCRVHSYLVVNRMSNAFAIYLRDIQNPKLRKLLSVIEYLEKTSNNTNKIKVRIKRDRRWFIEPVRSAVRDAILSQRPERTDLTYRVIWTGETFRLEFQE